MMKPEGLLPGTRPNIGPSVASQQKAARCPYGCFEAGIVENDAGYCKHLVGFAKQGQATMEPRELVPTGQTKTPDGETVESGWKIVVLGRHKVPIPKKSIRIAIGVTDRIYNEDGIPDYDEHMPAKEIEEFA